MGSETPTERSDDDLLTTGAAATILQVGRATVRRYADNGALPVIVLPSGQRRFRRRDVQALLEPRKAS